MEQIPQPSGNVARRGMTFLFNFSSWIWGSIAIVAGIASIGQNALLGPLFMVLGIALLPPIRRRMGRVTGVKAAKRIAVGSGLGILALMAMMGRDLQLEEEKEAKRRMEIAEAEARYDSSLAAHYPFLDRDSIQAWRMVAADSATNASHTLAAFVERQRTEYQRFVTDSIVRAAKWREDSIASAAKWREDSIVAAKERRRDSLELVREARRLAAEQDRLSRQIESRSASETYNGRTIYTGPRGGRYYINSNGRKTYIK